MTDFEIFALALGETESNRNRFAWGDQGLACGEWQQHPAFTFEWIRSSQVEVRSSWHDVFYRALHNFFNHFWALGKSPEEMAAIFHLGETAVRNGDTDDVYMAKFCANLLHFI